MRGEKRSAHCGTIVHTKEKLSEQRAEDCARDIKWYACESEERSTREELMTTRKSTIGTPVLNENGKWSVCDMKLCHLLHFKHWNSILHITDPQYWTNV